MRSTCAIAYSRVFPDGCGSTRLRRSVGSCCQRVVLLTLGSGEAALRLVPAGFGIGTLLVAAWAGRRWMGRLPAGVFVLLCAVGSWLAYYPSELKHYSADAFWALLLPTLAVWAVEGEEPRDQLRRARIWWALAAVAHWFSNGGLLAVPAAAAPLAIALSRRMHWRAVREMAAGGLVLLASFALHFVLSVRYTLGSEYSPRLLVGWIPAGFRRSQGRPGVVGVPTPTGCPDSRRNGSLDAVLERVDPRLCDGEAPPSHRARRAPVVRIRPRRPRHRSVARPRRVVGRAGALFRDCELHRSRDTPPAARLAGNGALYPQSPLPQWCLC